MFNCTWTYTGVLTGLQVHISKNWSRYDNLPEDKCKAGPVLFDLLYPAEIEAMEMLVNVSRYRKENDECHKYLPFGPYRVSLQANQTNGTTIATLGKVAAVDYPAPKLEYVHWINNTIMASWSYRLRQLDKYPDCAIYLQLRFTSKKLNKGIKGAFRADLGLVVHKISSDDLIAGEIYTVNLRVGLINNVGRPCDDRRYFNYIPDSSSNHIAGFVIPPSTPTNVTADVEPGSLNINWFSGDGIADLFQIDVKQIIDEGKSQALEVLRITVRPENITRRAPYKTAINGLSAAWYMFSVRAVSYGVEGMWSAQSDSVQIVKKTVTPHGPDIEPEELSGGAIAGIVIGGIVFVVVTVSITSVLTVKLVKRNISKAQTTEYNPQSPTIVSDENDYTARMPRNAPVRRPTPVRAPTPTIPHLESLYGGYEDIDDSLPFALEDGRQRQQDDSLPPLPDYLHPC